MRFQATKQKVLNRGVPPDSFLEELVAWAKSAPPEIFARNDVPVEIYTVVRPELGPYESDEHRRAVMCEVMRVHAGFESSWNWNEGVDVTNHTSMAHKTGQETGAWQVSFDSTYLAGKAMQPFARAHGIGVVDNFIRDLKINHPLAMEYYARLVRVNIKWAGPIIRGEINDWLRRDAVAEFQSLLST